MTNSAYGALEPHVFPERQYSSGGVYVREIRPNTATGEYLSFDQDYIRDDGDTKNSGTVFIHEDEVEDLIIYLTFWKQWREENNGKDDT